MRWSALPGSGAEAAAAARDHMWANDLTLRFLGSGEFAWYVWCALEKKGHRVVRMCASWLVIRVCVMAGHTYVMLLSGCPPAVAPLLGHSPAPAPWLTGWASTTTGGIAL